MKHMLHKGHANTRPHIFMGKFVSKKGKKGLVLHEGLNTLFRVPKNSFMEQWIFNIRGIPYWLTFVSVDMKKHLIWDLSTYDKKWRSLKNPDIIRYTDTLLELSKESSKSIIISKILKDTHASKGNITFTIEDMRELASALEEVEALNKDLEPIFTPSEEMATKFKNILYKRTENDRN